jgi:lipopolysaccharide heptosyltransferase II
MVVNPGTEPVLYRNPMLDDILVVNRQGWFQQLQFLSYIRSCRFDCVIDLTDGDRAAIITWWSGASIRIGFNRKRRWPGHLYTHCVEEGFGAMHMIDYHGQVFEALGVKPVLGEPEMFVGEDEQESGENLLQDLRLLGQPWVMMYPSARYQMKAWPVDRFAALCDFLGQKGLQVVLIGSGIEQNVAEDIQRLATRPVISLMGKTTLRQLATLMKRCSLFIGNDGGPMHMAAALGCPVVAIFGPSSPTMWTPRGSKVAVLYKGLDCAACFYPGCFRGEQSCLNLISVEEVLKEAMQMLS